MSSSERLLAASKAVTESMGTDGGRTLKGVGVGVRVGWEYASRQQRAFGHSSVRIVSAHDASQSSVDGFVCS